MAGTTFVLFRHVELFCLGEGPLLKVKVRTDRKSPLSSPTTLEYNCVSRNFVKYFCLASTVGLTYKKKGILLFFTVGILSSFGDLESSSKPTVSFSVVLFHFIFGIGKRTSKITKKNKIQSEKKRDRLVGLSI